LLIIERNQQLINNITELVALVTFFNNVVQLCLEAEDYYSKAEISRPLANG